MYGLILCERLSLSLGCDHLFLSCFVFGLGGTEIPVTFDVLFRSSLCNLMDICHCIVKNWQGYSQWYLIVQMSSAGICRHFRHVPASVPLLSQPIGTLCLGTWVPGIAEPGSRTLRILRQDEHLSHALAVLLEGLLFCSFRAHSGTLGLKGLEAHDWLGTN